MSNTEEWNINARKVRRKVVEELWVLCIALKRVTEKKMKLRTAMKCRIPDSSIGFGSLP